jgi:heavy metal sensor kinase
MNPWRRPMSVRVSLTLWYVAAMIVVLGLYAGGVLIFVSNNLSRGLDEQLRTDFQWAAQMAEQRPDGTLTWFDEDPNGGQDSPWLQVWDALGRPIFRTAVAERNPIPESQALLQHADERIVPVPLDPSTVRVLTGQSTIGRQRVVIQVAKSEAPMRRELQHLVLILVLGLPIGVAAAGLGGYSLARRALAPVERMAARARLITAERLSDRLPVDNPNDEFGRLAAVFNATLGRLESSFDQMRSFTADVSHQLRTPLTAIRSVGEVGLRGRRDSEAYCGVIASMLEEVDRLACLVDRLLTLSRTELGQAKLSLEAIDLRAFAEEVAAHLGVLAEEKGQVMTVEGNGSPHGVGDRLLLRQSLINLIDNAIKYTPPGGRIVVRVAELPTTVTIDVVDDGPGVVDELRVRIFDRYYRTGESRASEPGGSGLGLSITKWSVEMNGGQLSVEPTPGGGSTFRITLARATTPRQEARHLPSTAAGSVAAT